MKCLISRTFKLICLAALTGVMAAGCKAKEPVAVQGKHRAARDVNSTPTRLAAFGADDQPRGREAMAGHGKKPADPAAQPVDIFVRFSETGRSVVYIAGVGEKTRVVFNGQPGKLYQEISDYKLDLSPDGKHVAYGARSSDSWRMVVDGTEYGPYENVGPPVFSPDGQHIAYEAQKNGAWHMVVDHTHLSPASAPFFEKPFFSADSTRIAYVINGDDSGKMRLVDSDLTFSKQTVRPYEFVYVFQNPDKTHVAGVVKVSGAKLQVISAALGQGGNVTESGLYDDIRNVTFAEHGSTLSFAATRGNANMLVLNDKEERFPDAAVLGMTVIHPDSKGASLIMADKEGAFVRHCFSGSSAPVQHYPDANGLVYSADGSKFAFAASNGKGWGIVVNGKEGPATYDTIVSLQFSPDGTKTVFRARRGGKRFVVVADALTGATIREHQSYERVFEPVFTADGASVAYGVVEGKDLWWKVEKL